MLPLLLPCPKDLRQCSLEARSAWLAREAFDCKTSASSQLASPTSAAVRTPPANIFRAAEKMPRNVAYLGASEVASAASWQQHRPAG